MASASSTPRPVGGAFGAELAQGAVAFSHGSADKATSKRSAGCGRWIRGSGGQRVYISLDGEHLSGTAAVAQAALDKEATALPPALRAAFAQEDASAASAADNTAADPNALSMWGIPPKTCASYAAVGISRLWDWQVHALRQDEAAAMAGHSFVYSAPTSGGKTLLAEILMLRTILHRNKKVIFVVPFVSLCIEKTKHLVAMLQPLRLRVRAYYNNRGGGDMTGADIAVCTLERANSLVNRLMFDGALDTLGCVVVDELHMVGQASRGYLLELLIMKLRLVGSAPDEHASTAAAASASTATGGSTAVVPRRAPPRIQLVAMSATLPDLHSLAAWMHAHLFVSDSRPVPLTEYVYCDGVLYNKQMKPVRVLRRNVEAGVTSNGGAGAVGPVPPQFLDVSAELEQSSAQPGPGALPGRGQVTPTSSLSAAAPAARGAASVTSSGAGSATTGFIRASQVQVTLPPPREVDKQAPSVDDAVCALCWECVLAGHSVLVFVPTREGTVQVAKKIAAVLTAWSAGLPVPEQVQDARTATQTVLRQAPESEERATLVQLVAAGVAVHNAALTTEERDAVEDGYRAGLAIKVLVATTTVATGVNLPARRVIIMDAKNGNRGGGGGPSRNPGALSPHTSADYKQMAGRAGRTGQGDIGEAILITEPPVEVKPVAPAAQPPAAKYARYAQSNGAGARAQARQQPPQPKPLLLRLHDGTAVPEARGITALRRKLLAEANAAAGTAAGPPAAAPVALTLASPDLKHGSMEYSFRLLHAPLPRITSALGKLPTSEEIAACTAAATASASSESDSAGAAAVAAAATTHSAEHTDSFMSRTLAFMPTAEAVLASLCVPETDALHHLRRAVLELVCGGILRDVSRSALYIAAQATLLAHHAAQQGPAHLAIILARFESALLFLIQQEFVTLPPSFSVSVSHVSAATAASTAPTAAAPTSSAVGADEVEPVAAAAQELAAGRSIQVVATQLGLATFHSSLPPEDAVAAALEWRDVRDNGLCLDDDLHLLYLLTPRSLVRDIKPVDPSKFSLFYARNVVAHAPSVRVARLVGVPNAQPPRRVAPAPATAPVPPPASEAASAGSLAGVKRQRETGSDGPAPGASAAAATAAPVLALPAPAPARPQDTKLQTIRLRFLCALMIRSLLLQEPLARVQVEFDEVVKKPPMTVSSTAATYAGQVTSFLRELKWDSLCMLTKQYVERLDSCVPDELLPLLQLKDWGMTPTRARELYKAGLRTPQALAVAKVEQVIAALSKHQAFERRNAGASPFARVAADLVTGASLAVGDAVAAEAELALAKQRLR